MWILVLVDSRRKALGWDFKNRMNASLQLPQVVHDLRIFEIPP